MIRHVTFALLLMPATLRAQQPPDLAAVADTVFGAWRSTHGPGCAVGVARSGKVLLERAYGMADLESGAPNVPTTIFESGSVAKQFTAAATVLLALDGALDLDDPVRTYLPELPAYDRPLTIRHLLTHTSGLREWSSLVAAQGWPRGTRVHTQELLLDVVVRQQRLNYPVGDHYSYTNSGFGLLFTIVERVSGRSFQEFSRERIFAPLGMTRTRWRDDFRETVPGRAQAYEPAGRAWRLDMPFEDVVGPGGLLTTVGDLLRWNEALTNGTLSRALSDSLVRRMRLTSGRESHYALGIRFGDYRGIGEVAHSGATAGYRTFLARYPDADHLSVAVMCNAGSANPTALAHAMVDRLAVFPDATRPDTTAVAPGALDGVVGVYRNRRWHAPLTLDPDDLAPWRTLADGSFWTPGGPVLLDRDGGRVTGLRMVQSYGDTIGFAYAAAERWAPAAGTLDEFVGRYRSDEVGTTYDVVRSADTLWVQVRPGSRWPLRPAYRDAFTTFGTTVWFSRDRRGRVEAAHLSSSRMWDLVARRIR